MLAEFDRDKFRAGGSGFITQDEESSGIIDASKFLGNGWFLFDAQVHKTNPDATKVEFCSPCTCASSATCTTSRLTSRRSKSRAVSEGPAAAGPSA